MKKKMISLLLVFAMMITWIPMAVSAGESDEVYISISFDADYIADQNGDPVAYTAVSLEDLTAIDLNEYGLGDYIYDGDSDGMPDITALYLYIYVHENILGQDWADVYVSGGAGSIFFENGLFGFYDCNLRYDYNGAYPAIDGWGVTADQIVLSAGDFINIAGYTSWAFFGDSLTGFHYFADTEGNLNHFYTVNEGESCTLALVRSYSDWMNGGAAAFAEEPYYEVSYGSSYGVPTGTMQTDDYGKIMLNFPQPGTYYVWALGGYGAENPLDIVSAPAYAVVEVKEAAADPADPIDVSVSIADEGSIVMAQQKVKVTDLDASGDFTVDEVLYAAHEASYTGGAAAGYGSAVGSYGRYITKLWGDDSGNFGYWLNDAGCLSLDDKVVAGDSLVAFVYQNTTVWDSYAKFAADTYEVKAEAEATLILQKAGYDASWNTIFTNHSGATLKVYDDSFIELDAEDYEVTDNGDGTYAVAVKELGSYMVAAYDNTTPIVPALCVLNVKTNPDLVYADAVEEDIDAIDAIGEVTVHSYAKIKAARAAYEELSEEQKALVENYAVLTAAEDKLAELYEEAAKADPQSIFEETAAYLKGLGTPGVGSTGGEWMVIDLTRAGEECPEGYYENVVEFVEENINDKEQLHRSKSTENSRIILALTSAGHDVTDVAGHNLLMGLTDMNYVKKQGINGPIWALIAFDSHNYEIPENEEAADQVTREKLVAHILAAQLEDGGWDLGSRAADPDMTGMAIQALAPYYEENEEVKAAVDKALECLSKKQLDNGGFGSIDGACAESAAQVIVALTALGLDPETDERFVKNGISVVDALCMFAVEGGGFEHFPHGGRNGMATEQAQYALAAYFRYKNGQTSLYDMTDVDLDGEDDTQNNGNQTGGNEGQTGGNEGQTGNSNQNGGTAGGNSNSPQTGDRANSGTYVSLAVVSVIVLAALWMVAKKRKASER